MFSVTSFAHLSIPHLWISFRLQVVKFFFKLVPDPGYGLRTEVHTVKHSNGVCDLGSKSI